jgi:glycosyltransferase involved in cell wall biosynthesis
MTGGNKVIVIYAQMLSRMGHVVRLVSPPPQPIALRTKVRSLFSLKGWPVDHKSHPSQFDGSGLDHMVLERWRPVTNADVPDGDVVIATWWETAEWVASLASQKGAKVYFIQHHEVFPYLPAERSRATYCLPFHKIVVAKWLKDVMNSEYHDSDVDVVPNSVDKKQFFAPVRAKQNVPTIGFLFSRATFKGLDTLYPAIEQVRQSVPGLRLLSFGSHLPDRSCPLPDGVEFLHCPPQESIRDIYSRCDGWATASTSEGFNLPSMEAMACRTPVISTRAGWPAEAVRTGWNGVVVDVGDVREFAKGIEWLVSQTDENWKRISANAFATVEASSWETSALMFEQALFRARRRALQGEVAGRPS